MQEFLKETTKQAGVMALKYFRDGVDKEYKMNRGDVVTVADKAVEDFIITKILDKYPDHGIIGEENGEQGNSNASIKWVIDPIDGTRNFANKINCWCTMIGIEKDGQPYMGAIYDAINDELFWGETGKGSYVNDKRLQVSNYAKIKDSFIVFSHGINDKDNPYYSGGFDRYQKFYSNIMKINQGHWFYNFGNALEVCHVAAGRIDASLVDGLLYHDVLPSYVIATEAGAKFTNCYGNNWEKGQKNIVVANPKLHKELMKLFE